MILSLQAIEQFFFAILFNAPLVQRFFHQRLKINCTALREAFFTFLVCPTPDMVANAMQSTVINPWLVGDMFNYECNEQLVLMGTEENECGVQGNAAVWSLSTVLNNLPLCGEFKVLYAFVCLFVFCSF